MNLSRSHAPAWECREHRASGAGRYRGFTELQNKFISFPYERDIGFAQFPGTRDKILPLN
jgi:hypothetical protein